MELEIKLDNPYKIIIEKGSLNKLNDYIKEIYKNKNIYIITDERVAPLYLEIVKKALYDFVVDSVIVKGYEESKSLETYEYVCEELIKKGIKRSHLIIALGGGVIGDLTGFVASTLYRGVDFVQIPTTLLAQVDSSIGGKVAVNLPSGKNLIGAFYQPKLVVIDSNTLNTLPKREFSCGMAELIKSAFIGNKKLVGMLGGEITDEIIKETLTVKKRVVEIDQFDTGERMILNFGHTFGHAIEKKFGFGHYLHGEAVSIGMLMAMQLGIKLGISKKEDYDLLKSLLIKYDLPVNEFDIKEYLDLIKYDKKNIAGVINFIFITEIGKTEIYKIKEEDLKKLM